MRQPVLIGTAIAVRNYLSQSYAVILSCTTKYRRLISFECSQHAVEWVCILIIFILKNINYAVTSRSKRFFGSFWFFSHKQYTRFIPCIWVFTRVFKCVLKNVSSEIRRWSYVLYVTYIFWSIIGINSFFFNEKYIREYIFYEF